LLVGSTRLAGRHDRGQDRRRRFRDFGRIRELGDMSGGMKLLAPGFEAMGLEVEADAVNRLYAFVDLLARWNQAYNLTAIREPAKILTHHILDSAAVVPYLHGERLLDIGTGAGLPGIVIAVLRPDMQCVLLDTNAKKTRFVTQAVLELGLGNVEVVHQRGHLYRPTAPFDVVVTRALGRLNMVWKLAWPLLAEDGRLLAMTGKRPESELRELEMEQDGLVEAEVIALQVPGLDAERHLVVVGA